MFQVHPTSNLRASLTRDANGQVLYSKFGFMYTDLKLNSEDYILIREEDVIGTMPKPSELQ